MNVDGLEAYCARLESDVADLGLAVQELREELADAVAGGNVKAEPPTVDEVAEWVSEWLSVHVARHLGPAHKWCPRWVDHPEAVMRLSALYTGHREAQQSGRVLAFLRDLDAQMTVLTSADGPFAACSGRGHHAPPRLPC